MGRGLFESSRVYRQICERSAELIKPHLDRPLLDILFGSEPIDDTIYAQPALFAVEYALAELWKSWGVVPDLVMGHSVGELVAATVSGAMSLEDGLRLVATRGRLMQSLPRDGAMAVVFADEATVTSALAGFERTLAVAAVNGPRHTVVSGAAKELYWLLVTLGERNIRHTRLTVSHAFHSPLMDPILDEFERLAGTVSFRPPSCVLISNVTGAPLNATDLTAAYWRRHARAAVQFLDGIQQVIAHHIDIALEIGPPPVLIGLAERILSGTPLVMVEGLSEARTIGRRCVNRRPSCMCAECGSTGQLSTVKLRGIVSRCRSRHSNVSGTGLSDLKKAGPAEKARALVRHILSLGSPLSWPRARTSPSGKQRSASAAFLISLTTAFRIEPSFLPPCT